jgi:histone deacetylase 6
MQVAGWAVRAVVFDLGLRDTRFGLTGERLRENFAADMAADVKNTSGVQSLFSKVLLRAAAKTDGLSHLKIEQFRYRIRSETPVRYCARRRMPGDREVVCGTPEGAAEWRMRYDVEAALAEVLGAVCGETGGEASPSSKTKASRSAGGLDCTDCGKSFTSRAAFNGHLSSCGRPRAGERVGRQRLLPAAAAAVAALDAGQHLVEIKERRRAGELVGFLLYKDGKYHSSFSDGGIPRLKMNWRLATAAGEEAGGQDFPCPIPGMPGYCKRAVDEVVLPADAGAALSITLSGGSSGPRPGLQAPGLDETWLCKNCTWHNELTEEACVFCRDARTNSPEGAAYVFDPGRKPKPLFQQTRPTIPRLAIGYDSRMLLHKPPAELLPTGEEPDHPERPDRVRCTYDFLKTAGLMQAVLAVSGRVASEAELLLVHSQPHVDMVETAVAACLKNAEDDSYSCADTPLSAKVAVGCTVDTLASVPAGTARHAVALVRPPGHHACINASSGFCCFNNLAIAVKSAQAKFGLERVMVVDWDVHHGNGTQDCFYDDPSVLTLSIHRGDPDFFPKTGQPYELGTGDGLGFNVNVAWSGAGAIDADYLHAFQTVVLPILYEFRPELVVVAAGFDAGEGDPLGECHVSPECYAHMTAMLSTAACGKIGLVLEGGYNLQTISRSIAACINGLHDDLPPLPSMQPRPEAIADVQQTMLTLAELDVWAFCAGHLRAAGGRVSRPRAAGTAAARRLSGSPPARDAQQQLEPPQHQTKEKAQQAKPEQPAVREPGSGPCPRCRKSFVSKLAFNGHKSSCTISGTEQSQHCPKCDKTFGSRSAFNGHLSSCGKIPANSKKRRRDAAEAARRGQEEREVREAGERQVDGKLKRRMWSAGEETALQKAVGEHGEGRWKQIHDDPDYPFLESTRSTADLKDKWRSLKDKEAPASDGEGSADETEGSGGSDSDSDESVQPVPSWGVAFERLDAPVIRGSDEKFNSAAKRTAIEARLLKEFLPTDKAGAHLSRTPAQQDLRRWTRAGQQQFWANRQNFWLQIGSNRLSRLRTACSSRQLNTQGTGFDLRRRLILFDYDARMLGPMDFANADASEPLESIWLKAGGIVGCGDSLSAEAIANVVRELVRAVASHNRFSLYSRIEMGYMPEHSTEMKWYPGWVATEPNLDNKVDIAFMDGNTEPGVSLYDPDLRIADIDQAQPPLYFHAAGTRALPSAQAMEPAPRTAVNGAELTKQHGVASSGAVQPGRAGLKRGRHEQQSTDSSETESSGEGEPPKRPKHAPVGRTTGAAARAGAAAVQLLATVTRGSKELSKLAFGAPGSRQAWIYPQQGRPISPRVRGCARRVATCAKRIGALLS